MRIVAQLRAFLVSEDRLYGIVDVGYVREGRQSVEDVLLVSHEPCVQLATVSRLERAPYTVLADDPPKSEQCRKHRVVSQPVDVDVPRKSADDREHGRADDVADIGGVSYCGWLFLCNSKHTIFRGLLFSFTHCVKHKNRSKAPVSLPQTAIRVIQLPNLG